ncbi:hypothetical protein RJ639_005148 [Escallonia herrerae]|uniref:Uncharacterized protein n=1 Tax=Escallonia herrerae TaxID=1293975 RepID=A0AA88W435_9ASTE|nr:hypothetical protein RJ639_005148 [Escallonia herrerae]
MANVHYEDHRGAGTSIEKLTEMIKINVVDDCDTIREWEAAIRGEQRYSGVANEKLKEKNNTQAELQLAEKFKPRALLEYVSGCDRKSINDLYNKVLEMVDIARSCYVEGSTDAYDDEEFSRMMLLDACFILSVICSVASEYNPAEMIIGKKFTIDFGAVILLHYEYLGALGWANIFRDIFLLENQVPYEVLRVLINFRSDVGDEREETMNRFVDYIVHRQRTSKPEGSTLGTSISQRWPSHLLEMYRTSFLKCTSNQERSWKFKF